MQTFLPYPDFKKSAKVLDFRRLGKQRGEVYQILRTIRYSGGWRKHPAVKMWKGYERALIEYGLIVCKEWKKRGYVDNMAKRIKEEFPGYLKREIVYPPWFGNEKFHSSHRKALIYKNPTWYKTFWPDEIGELNYYWPTKEKEKEDERN